MKQELTPCDVIFNYVNKPAGYMFCRAINVFDDRYRINIYSKRTINDIDTIRISDSYFARFKDNILEIV